MDVPKDREKFLKDGIADEKVTKLVELKSKNKSINFEQSKRVLFPMNLKKFNKIERLTLLYERNEKINKVIWLIVNLQKNVLKLIQEID